MTDQFGTEALLRLLGETRTALESMRGEPPAPGEEVRGTGSAADGQITATVSAANRIDSLQINPRLMRMASEELAEQIVAAVNAAFAEFAERARDSAPEPGVDVGQLAGRLRTLQDESVRSMASLSQAMAEALDQVRRSGR